MQMSPHRAFEARRSPDTLVPGHCDLAIYSQVIIDAAYMLDKDSRHVHVALAVSDETKARNILKL
jgi:hypothetical protein